MKNKVTINRDLLPSLKAKLMKSGSFFSISFTKKDGTARELVGRFKVTKHLKGGVSRNNAEHWTLWDVNYGYRSVDPCRVKSVVALGNEFIVE